MYLYSLVLTYVGSDPFIQQLWQRLTRGTGSMPVSATMTPAQASTLKGQGTTAGFTMTKIVRTPVVTAEDVTGST